MPILRGRRRRDFVSGFFPVRFMSDSRFARESGPVHLRVDDLPADVARALRDAQAEDPRFLRSILLYGIVHRTVFETLSQSWGG